MAMTFATDVAIDSSHCLSLQGQKVYYGTCSTISSTATKAVVCDGFTLETGNIIWVKFSWENTATTSTVKINVNSTGAKSVKKIANGSCSNLSNSNEIGTGAPIAFYYDGTYWVLMTTGYEPIYKNNIINQASKIGLCHPGDTNDAIRQLSCAKVVLYSVSSLPKTYTVYGLTSEYEVTKSVLSVPEAQGSDWTITTDDDELTISGTFRGTDPTNITLYLAVPYELTATEVVSE